MMSLAACSSTIRSHTKFYSKECDRKEARAYATTLRNEEVFPLIAEGEVSISPLEKIAHIWNLALQSPFFNSLWRSKFRESVELAQNGAKICLQGLDQEILAWLIDYMESSDKKRLQMLDNLSLDSVFELCLGTDFFQMRWLREKLELILIQHLSSDANTIVAISSLELHSFKYLKRFLFLIKWFGESLSFEESFQKARSTILSQLKQTPELAFNTTKLDFLLAISKNEAPQMEFLAEGVDDLDALDQIARNFKSKKLLLHVLQARLKALGFDLLTPSSKKLYIDGLHPDNYFPNRKPEPESDRYRIQKNFFAAPCPSPAYDAVIECSYLKRDVLALIKDYSTLKLGIRLSKVATDCTEMPNVRLLAYEEANADELIKILPLFPKLEILVVNPRAANTLAQSITEKKIAIWQSLQGKAIKKRVAIRNAFDMEWEKEVNLLKIK